MSWWQEIDQQAFLWLNGLHADWLDPIMLSITGRNTWIPFYLALIGWFIYKQKTAALWSLLAITLSIILADQLTSSLMKPFFERLRPCHDPSMAQLVHLVGGCGGKFGFASSHAANTFALATIVTLLHPGRWTIGLGIFFWAIVVSYSRIYVGVHYPADIVVGALTGTAGACLIVWLGSKTRKLQHV